jgi:hypothetical protein
MKTNKVGIPIVKPDLSIRDNWTEWLRNLVRGFFLIGFVSGLLFGIALLEFILMIVK